MGIGSSTPLAEPCTYTTSPTHAGSPVLLMLEGGTRVILRGLQGEADEYNLCEGIVRGFQPMANRYLVSLQQKRSVSPFRGRTPSGFPMKTPPRPPPRRPSTPDRACHSTPEKQTPSSPNATPATSRAPNTLYPVDVPMEEGEKETWHSIHPDNVMQRVTCELQGLHGSQEHLNGRFGVITGIADAGFGFGGGYRVLVQGQLESVESSNAILPVGAHVRVVNLPFFLDQQL
jgi:hypothetical protein